MSERASGRVGERAWRRAGVSAAIDDAVYRPIAARESHKSYRSHRSYSGQPPRPLNS